LRNRKMMSAKKMLTQVSIHSIHRYQLATVRVLFQMSRVWLKTLAKVKTKTPRKAPK